MKGYNFIGIVHLVFSYVLTKIFYSKAKLVRFPFSARGVKYIDLGEKLVTGRYCRIDSFPKDKDCGYLIRFGSNCQINDGVHIASVSNITIGNNVLIASRVFITDHFHGSYSGEIQSNPCELAAERELYYDSVIIEDNVWIGEGCSILPGTVIGKNSVIGANSVVTKSIPSDSIAVGNPARVIKKFDQNTKKWVLVSDG
ncbi:DapH/DapD/GlmU-related protein [Vibrio astriarenae]